MKVDRRQPQKSLHSVHVKKELKNTMKITAQNDNNGTLSRLNSL